ncbi:hypothetical protein HA466_0232030 [Hirschfeldia incana]|nr:hypothetical protein HA466_0232030 [Hirschfeldia incana]
MISSKKLILLTFSALGLIIVAKSDRTLSLGKDEKELVRFLTSINKPAIQSFQSEHGDILDCIDINKQLAFDHPLLKNHTIQLMPTAIPKWNINNNKNSKNGDSVPFRQDGISCPSGTVVVKRTTQEDLIQAQRLKSMGSEYSRHISPEGKNIELTGFHFAVAEYRHSVFGANVNLSMWEPEVSPTQFSSSSMLIAQGSKAQFQSIRAGWIADGFIKTGCYNILCPGFVQVSTKIPLGTLMGPVSVYHGPQYEVGIRIYKDGNTGDWWLVVYDENVGYWPNSLFTKAGLGHGASLVAYGGEVFSPVNEKSPSMGSGHFPSEGYSKAAYVNNFEVVEGGVAKKPPFTVKLFASTPNCYKASLRRKRKVWYNSIFFGGPGGCV